MQAADIALARIASRQFGLVTHHQATIDAGLSRRQVDFRLAAGALVAVHRGVYQMAAVPPSFEASVLGACLATGGVASHKAAAQLWGLRGVERAGPEITVVAKRRSRLAGITSHTTDTLDRADVARRGPIPVTRPARTLLDLGATAPKLVIPATEDALCRGLVTVRSLRGVLDRVGASGRRGTGVLREVVDARDPALAPTESLLEDAVVAVLRRYGLPEPARQHWVRLPDGSRARLDLAYPDVLIAIEANGLRWHSSTADVERDQRRANALAALGWVVLVFTWADVRDGDRVAREVARVRAARRRAA